MAISKKGFRKITVNQEVFLWKIRKKVSPDERHNDQYGIPVQHISEGQVLFIYIGFSRSEGYGRKELIVTPALIADKIKLAIELGWNYKEVGNAISLVNGKLLKDTKTAKWMAG